MTETSSASQSPLVESVLRLSPRLAVFDCDGTLWSGDAGERFFDWELKRGVLSDEIAHWARARYAEYLAGKVSEDDMCGEMVQLHKGLREEDVLRDVGGSGRGRNLARRHQRRRPPRLVPHRCDVERDVAPGNDERAVDEWRAAARGGRPAGVNPAPE